MAKLYYLTVVVMLVVGILIRPAPFAAAAEIVVSREVKEVSIRRETVRSIFMGNLTKWKDGRQIVVLVLPPDHPSTKSFAWNVLRIAPHEFERRIAFLTEVRETSAPRVVETEREMMRLVAMIPNSIGYISSAIIINGVEGGPRIVPVL